MEYGKPAKLQDGRYFLRITSSDSDTRRVLKQINSAEVQEAGCFKVPCTLQEFDEQILKQAEISSEEWFGKKIDPEALSKAYDSSVSAGILEAPLARKSSGEIVAKVFDAKKNELSPSVLVPGTRCDIVVELSGLWFLKKSFGPVWRVIQVRLKKESTFPSTYMFEGGDDDSGDDELFSGGGGDDA